MDENIQVLKGIGLTMYEAQAYVTLTSLIQASAFEVAEKSNIPRSKIYDVLKKLYEKNFIEIEDGRPLTYIVKSPVEVLSRKKEEINERLNTYPNHFWILENDGKMVIYFNNNNHYLRNWYIISQFL